MCDAQRLKSALWFHIGKIVDEETIKLGVNATPQFIGSLAELVWAQIGMGHHTQVFSTSESQNTNYCSMQLMLQSI